MKSQITDKHESYGLLQLSRKQGPSTALFGSSIMHENTISLRVTPAETNRDINKDRFYASPSPWGIDGKYGKGSNAHDDGRI